MKRVIHIKESSMERICSVILFAVGTVFLLMALFGAWRYFFTMGVCYAAGFLFREVDEEKEDGHK